MEPIRTGPVCRLGEGLLVADGAVVWLDILRRSLHRYAERRVRSYDLGVEATVALAADSGRVLLGSTEGLAWFDFAVGELESTPEAKCLSLPQGFRTNDGCRLRSGHAILGTMHRDAPESHPGTILCIDPSGRIHDLAEALRIPNSFIELDDGAVLITDSAEQTIYRYQFDSVSGLSNRTIWYRHDGEGTPDGGCLLPDGRIAVAIWDEARVAIFTADGEFAASIAVPALRPTNCKVDEGRDVIWVTSASEGLGTDGRSDLPYSGYTFGFSLP